MGRLGLIYGLTFLLIAGLFFAGALQIVSRKNIEKADALLVGEVAELRDKIMELPAAYRVEVARTLVATRTRAGKGQVRYALAQDSRVWGDRAIALLPPTARASTTLREGLSMVVVRRLEIGSGATLVVARRVGDASSERDLALAAGLGIVLAALSTLIVGPLTGARLLRRVQSVNAACDAFGDGDLQARAPGAEARDEFGELSRSVNAMFIRIETLVSSVRHVSDGIAHDLKTPLARVKDRLATIQTETSLVQAKAIADAANREIDDLLSAFNALLDLSELQAGVAPRLEPLDLADVATSVTALYADLAQEHGVTLDLQAVSIDILGNEPLLIRAAANLIDNALKYAPASTTLIVATERRDDRAWLTVTDRGPGIPAALHDRMFDRFQRGPEQREPGHGLGLALVRAVARLHGGDAALSASPAPPGLRVQIWIPTAPSSR